MLYGIQTLRVITELNPLMLPERHSLQWNNGPLSEDTSNNGKCSYTPYLEKS